MFKKFSHPMLYVNDLGRAVAWYKDVLGFQENFVAPNSYASLFHKGMNFRLDLHPTEANSKDIGFGAIQYFLVEDIDATVNSLKSKGVRVSAPRREGDSPRFATFWDSEGNALGVEEIRA
jgi:predicted enzyme related to lactoylglutathione lyase